MGVPEVALVGVGRWGRQHLRVLRELGAFAGAADLDPRRLPEDGALSSWKALLGTPSIAGVVIATPPRTHARLAREALLAGKDVLVEKPMVLEEREGRELVALARRLGRVLMVGHVTLYHPAVEKLLSLAADGTLGRLHYAHATRLNLGIVRPDEDALWSFAPHDFALLTTLFGARPHRVHATGGCFLKPGRHDVTVTHLAFPQGAKAHVFVSWLHPVKEHRLVVVGDRRMAVFTDAPGGGELLLFEQGARIAEGVPVPRDGSGSPIDYRFEEPLRRELAHFLRCIETRETPRTSGEHAQGVVEILAAARNCLAEGATPGGDATEAAGRVG